VAAWAYAFANIEFANSALMVIRGHHASRSETIGGYRVSEGAAFAGDIDRHVQRTSKRASSKIIVRSVLEIVYSNPYEKLATIGTARYPPAAIFGKRQKLDAAQHPKMLAVYVQTFEHTNGYAHMDISIPRQY
jgi:hypothetical protein